MSVKTNELEKWLKHVQTGEFRYSDVMGKATECPIGTSDADFDKAHFEVCYDTQAAIDSASEVLGLAFAAEQAAIAALNLIVHERGIEAASIALVEVIRSTDRWNHAEEAKAS